MSKTRLAISIVLAIAVLAASYAVAKKKQKRPVPPFFKVGQTIDLGKAIKHGVIYNKTSLCAWNNTCRTVFVVTKGKLTVQIVHEYPSTEYEVITKPPLTSPELDKNRLVGTNAETLNDDLNQSLRYLVATQRSWLTAKQKAYLKSAK